MPEESRQCQNCKQAFRIDAEDFQFYDRVQVPAPTFCPNCRMQRRMAFRNERFLYKDICDLCKKTIVSSYSPDKPFIVYCRECWHSDKWDPLTYGREYDWQKPFFMQFRELMKQVPRISLVQISTNLNCDYANYIVDAKNVYLSQSIASSENIYYSYAIDKSTDIFDSFQVRESARGYENVEGIRNHKSNFLFRSRDCIDSSFLFDCVNCQNCFMSSNLRNKRYVLRNVQYSKEEYDIRMKDIHVGTYACLEELKKEFEELTKHAVHKYAELVKAVACTGDNLMNDKNVRSSFSVTNSENCKFCIRLVGGGKEAYDITGGVTGELLYEIAVSGRDGYNIRLSDNADVLRNSQYSDWCQSSSDLFGCVSVRSGQYCILNKQYSKQEYEALTSKIITHMDSMPFKNAKGIVYKFGEFFPIEISPFAYNESMAEEYFPLSKTEVQEQGYAWREPDPNPYTPTLTADGLPKDIQSASESITKEIIACATCSRVFRILQPELEFLKQEGIALPRKCQECRHKDRFALRNPLKLWHRQCMCGYQKRGNSTKHSHHPEGRCPNEFETSYAPDRPEVIYCEQCYQAEVV